MAEPLRSFVVDEIHTVTLPEEQFLNSSFLGVPTVIKGDRYQFDFNWIGREGFYTIDVFGPGLDRLFRMIPRPDTPYRYEAFFDDPNAPDAEVFVGTETAGKNPVTPTTFADGHHTLNVASGRLVTR